MKIKKEIPYLSLGSIVFPNVYLRMDGGDVTGESGPGIVNCQIGASTNELFKLTQYEDDTYTIESMAFPGIFLRMNGTGVTQFSETSGTVNCRLGAEKWEHFKFHKQDDGTYTIESAHFPRVFLRMNGTGVKDFKATGSGTVDCRFDAEAWEKFRISPEL